MPVTLGDFAVTAILGYAVVFFGLALLMVVVTIMGKIMISVRPGRSQTIPPVPDDPAPPAPGAAGEVKLYDVPDKEAAILMAIVADQMGKPLNELRFKSIKEVR